MLYCTVVVRPYQERTHTQYGTGSIEHTICRVTDSSRSALEYQPKKKKKLGAPRVAKNPRFLSSPQALIHPSSHGVVHVHLARTHANHTAPVMWSWLAGANLRLLRRASYSARIGLLGAARRKCRSPQLVRPASGSLPEASLRDASCMRRDVASIVSGIGRVLSLSRKVVVGRASIPEENLI